MAAVSSSLSIVRPSTGVDDYAHRPLLVSNEDDQHVTIRTLQKKAITGNAIIGVGGFFTLDATAALGSNQHGGSIDRIFLLDRSLRVEHFWQEAIQIIQNSTNRLQVADRIKALLKKEAHRYFSGDLGTPEDLASSEGDELTLALMRSSSWLSDDTKFNRIKSIFDRGHFAFYRVDLFDKTAMQDFSTMLRGKKIVVDTMYLSNVGEYATWTQLPSFSTCMEMVVQPNTSIISAHSLAPHEPPVQYVRQKGKNHMRNFLFPQPKDLLPPPSATQVAMRSLVNLCGWLYDHRHTVVVAGAATSYMIWQYLNKETQTAS